MSCEKLVSTEELVGGGPLQSLLINRMMVRGVVEAPGGAHFTECPPDYGRDEAFQREYAATAKDPEAWQQFRALWPDATLAYMREEHLDKWFYAQPELIDISARHGRTPAQAAIAWVLGHEAISLTGAQIGIVTDSVHTKARIRSISTDRIRDALDTGRIVIAAGFQGVDDTVVVAVYRLRITGISPGLLDI